jgi:hypothetical protein
VVDALLIFQVEDVREEKVVKEENQENAVVRVPFF